MPKSLKSPLIWPKFAQCPALSPPPPSIHQFTNMISSSVTWFQRDLDRMDEDSLRRILQQVLVQQPGILFEEARLPLIPAEKHHPGASVADAGRCPQIWRGYSATRILTNACQLDRLVAEKNCFCFLNFCIIAY